MKLPKHFIDAIGVDPANCILIVGAGLSKVGVREGGGGLPDWDELMQAMVGHLEGTGRCDETKLAQLQSLLSEDPPQYLDVAEEFAIAHGDDRDGYETFLRRLLMPDDLVESELHKLILTIGFRGIVSFNFDRVFEKQSDKLVPIVYPELTEQVGHFQRRGFFAKIHGCITKPARQLVLTRSSYDELRSQTAYSQLLQVHLLAHKVLCVGFSLRDPDFLNILADLKEFWGENFSPLYSLMLDPGQDERKQWLNQGVAILPYQDHAEVNEFFAELAELSPNGSEPKRKLGSALGKTTSDIAVVLSDWQKAQKIEEMNSVLSDALSSVADETETEHLLYELAGLCRADQQIHLCPRLVAVGTPACNRLALRILANNAADDKDNLKSLKPHTLHVPLHQWIVEQKEWPFGIEPVVRWLLDKEWTSAGVDLWKTFLAILNRLLSSDRRDGLDKLYSASEHIAGASAEIEKVVFASGFVREDDPDRRWYKSWDQRIANAIRSQKADKQFIGIRRKTLSPAEMLKEAAMLDDSLPGNSSDYTRKAIEQLVESFVHVSFLTIHGHSTLYDPAKAKEILNVLASLRDQSMQDDVLRVIARWGEHHEGLMGLEDHAKDLQNGLLTPLWWRFSSATRLQYLEYSKDRRGGRRRYCSPWSGQEFLLKEMMGLNYDEDEDFRHAFNQSLKRYRSPANPNEYEPRPLEELWREREFRYEMSDDCPPEIVRRVAIFRNDWERMRDGAVGWAEAKERAEALWQQRHSRQEYVSTEHGDYVIDNLLGAYFPVQRRVVLYRKMVGYAAAELGVDEDALLTVVYMHETVHAFSHLGGDLNGNMWEDFAIPIGDSPDERPVEAHEAIAQFYTFKLLEWLDDKRLMDVFLMLEQKCSPVYRAWRRTEDYSLEDMRRILLRLRGSTETWPPID